MGEGYTWGSGWGDPRGIRWGSWGDPVLKWGIRCKKHQFCVGFGGDPPGAINLYIILIKEIDMFLEERREEGGGLL